MDKVKIGIIGTADIAYRRFLPALQSSENFEYVGVATRGNERANLFKNTFGGKVYNNYEELVKDPNVDALYIPLPPSLHFKWGKMGVEFNKHVFMEKPFTTDMRDTTEIIEMAEKNKIAVHENYMFEFHRQINKIKENIIKKKIGELRNITIKFGFPKRNDSDFRYNKELGGGALLDCGGYAIKLACILLGDKISVLSSVLNIDCGYQIDMFGNVSLMDQEGIVANLSFGMDNEYKCEVEVWGSRGNIKAERVFTAPPEMEIELALCREGYNSSIEVGKDNHFKNSIDFFYECITDNRTRIYQYEKIKLISKIQNETLEKAKLVYI